MVSSPTGIQNKNETRFANFSYKDITEDVDLLYSQVNGPSDDGFYTNILTNWRKNSYDEALAIGIFIQNTPNELGLKRGDLTYATFYDPNDGPNTYPVKILGFGLGPYKGAVYIQWLKFKGVTNPIGDILHFVTISVYTLIVITNKLMQIIVRDQCTGGRRSVSSSTGECSQCKKCRDCKRFEIH